MRRLCIVRKVFVFAATCLPLCKDNLCLVWVCRCPRRVAVQPKLITLPKAAKWHHMLPVKKIRRTAPDYGLALYPPCVSYNPFSNNGFDANQSVHLLIENTN